MDRTMPPIPGATPPPIDPFTAWKQSNPIRWKMEQFAMQHHFPGFTFVNESRPAWRGVLSSPRLNQDYTVEIILNFYNRLNDNPEYLVIPLGPYINELFPIDNSSLSALKDSLLSWQKISDSDSLLNLHLEKEEKPRSNQTAASYLLKALDWFEYYETKNTTHKTLDAAAKKRKELRERLSRIKHNKIGHGNQNDSQSDTSSDYLKIHIPDSRDYAWNCLSQFRIDYLHRFFPSIQASHNNTLEGRSITLMGPLVVGIVTNPSTSQPISYEIKIAFSKYRAHFHISVSDEDLKYISESIGYTPNPFTQDYSMKYNSAISTYLDAVLDVFNWLTLQELAIKDDNLISLSNKSENNPINDCDENFIQLNESLMSFL